MTHYLLELGCEEIPARFVDGFTQELKEKFQSKLTENRIAFKDISTLSSYRRLTVIINEIADMQTDYTEVVKGPPSAISKSASGEFLPPAIGFAKKLNIDIAQLKEKEFDGKVCLYSEQFQKGKPITDVLPSVVVDIVTTLSLPIAMKWGDNQGPFIRPIHWIVSVLGNTVLPLTLFGIAAGNVSYGHRFLHADSGSISGKKIVINTPDEYEPSLRDHYVLVDPEKRKEKIKESVLASKATLDEALLAEVTHLTEWPMPLQGAFDSRYLTVPEPVLIQCMRKHQKYFPIHESGALKASFVCIAENVTESNKAIILKGNEQVLTARLEDVNFFWKEDIKVPLEENKEKLKKVVFQKNLGSIWDKVDRMKHIAKGLLPATGFSLTNEQIEKGVELCKADLVSQLVFELPDLQGTVGKYIYHAQHPDKAQEALAIEEHYLPRFQGDALPTTELGTLIGLADRIDTIAACFFNKLIPTGSQDPWGVRRAIFAILNSLLNKKIDLNIQAALKDAYQQFGPLDGNFDKLTEFLQSRIKSFLMDQYTVKLEYDVVDSILKKAVESPVTAVQVAEKIRAFKQSSPDAFKSWIESAVRVKRLASKLEGNVVVKEELFKEPQEKKVWEEYTQVSHQLTIDTWIPNTTTLVPSLIAFFDHVLVMDKDDAIKNNRLALLKNVSDLFTEYSDLECIVSG